MRRMQCAAVFTALRFGEPESRSSPFSSSSTRYHGRYYDGFLGNLYLPKGLILLVGAPGLEPGTR